MEPSGRNRLPIGAHGKEEVDNLQVERLSRLAVFEHGPPLLPNAATARLHMYYTGSAGW